jgi:hypothetical protein
MLTAHHLKAGLLNDCFGRPLGKQKTASCGIPMIPKCLLTWLSHLYKTTMLAKIYKLGGDTDTIGAMAGAIWGAFNGCDAIDKSTIKCVENSAKIIELSEQLSAISVNK